VSVCLCLCAFTFVQLRGLIRAKNVVLRGCGKLLGAISYFLTSRLSQVDVEAANDVDPKYQLNPCSIVSVQVRVGDMWVIGVVWACILIFV